MLALHANFTLFSSFQRWHHFWWDYFPYFAYYSLLVYSEKSLEFQLYLNIPQVSHEYVPLIYRFFRLKRQRRKKYIKFSFFKGMIKVLHTSNSCHEVF